MILQYFNGKIIFSTFWALRQCGDVLEVKLRAMMEGLALALEGPQLPIIVDTYGVEVARMIPTKERNISRIGHLVVEPHTITLSSQILSGSKDPDPRM
jgi:hypothetical protein